MNISGIKTSFRCMVAMLLLALPLASLDAQQLKFSTPEAAVETLLAALKSNDEISLVSIFGEKYRNLIVTRDHAYDSARRAETAEKITAFHTLIERGADTRQLLIGVEAWPVPIPLVREAGQWRFASEQGVQEMLNRQIGKNERYALRVQLAYLNAQREYASRDRNNDGVLEYAQKLASSPGKQDGLYWPADEAKGEEVSPFGPLIAASADYLAGHKQGDPYHGYYFRILTGQGKSAPGGAYSYLINGRMIAGFAMIACPASYGESGVMTFIVNHNGKVYEKDLGQQTVRRCSGISRFNPDKSWKEVTALEATAAIE